MHIETQHTPLHERRTYACAYCSRTFLSRQGLKGHVKKIVTIDKIENIIVVAEQIC